GVDRDAATPERGSPHCPRAGQPSTTYEPRRRLVTWVARRRDGTRSPGLDPRRWQNARTVRRLRDRGVTACPRGVCHRHARQARASRPPTPPGGRVASVRRRPRRGPRRAGRRTRSVRRRDARRNRPRGARLACPVGSVMTERRRWFGLGALWTFISIVLLLGLVALVFGPGRGIRSDIARQKQLISDQLAVTRDQLEATRQQLDLTRRQLDITSDQLALTTEQKQIALQQLDIASQQLDLTRRQLDIT